LDAPLHIEPCGAAAVAGDNRQDVTARVEGHMDVLPDRTVPVAAGSCSETIDIKLKAVVGVDRDLGLVGDLLEIELVAEIAGLQGRVLKGAGARPDPA